MYKLVVVGGKLRGQEFELTDGENVLGRDTECDIPFSVQGVSKRHLMVTVTNDTAYLQDLDSSNGTFLNGKIIKQATIKNGDRIALPDSILQVVHVEEKKIIIRKKVDSEDEEEDEDAFFNGGLPPENLVAKLKWLFKYRIMKFFHGFNEEYEWRVLFGILLGVFILASVSFTILPVFTSSGEVLQREIALRGIHYADEISRINARALESKNLNQVETLFLDREEGVESYELFDLEGRIVSPKSRLNEYTSTPFSVRALDWAKRSKRKGEYYPEKLDGGFGIAKKIVAYNQRLGIEEPVGVIAIKFRPQSLVFAATKQKKAFFEALATSILVAFFFFLIVYYLTLRPIEEIRYQIEDALRGKRRNLESRYLMEELDSLRNSINSLLQRNRELQNDGDDSDFAELESDESYVNSLREFMRGAGIPVVILNSEKNVASINPEAEDLTGIRESSSEGMSLLDVAREKGFAATVIELCDNSANNGGTSQEGEYELSGIPHNIFVTSLLGKDGFAKAFYITFIRED